MNKDVILKRKVPHYVVVVGLRSELGEVWCLRERRERCSRSSCRLLYKVITSLITRLSPGRLSDTNIHSPGQARRDKIPQLQSVLVILTFPSPPVPVTALAGVMKTSPVQGWTLCMGSWEILLKITLFWRTWPINKSGLDILKSQHRRTQHSQHSRAIKLHL